MASQATSTNRPFRSGNIVTVVTGSLAGERGEVTECTATCVWVDLGDDTYRFHPDSLRLHKSRERKTYF